MELYMEKQTKISSAKRPYSLLHKPKSNPRDCGAKFFICNCYIDSI